MEKYVLEKHRKLIESLRLMGMFALGFFANSHFLLAFLLALVIGSLDRIFIVPKLKPRGKTIDL